VTEQAEPGHVGAGFDESALGELSAGALSMDIERMAALASAGGQMSRLMPVVMIPVPSGLVSHEPTDGTPVALAAFGDRIQVVHQANRGLAAARSAGAAGGPGHTACVMDGDDFGATRAHPNASRGLAGPAGGRARLQQFQRISRFAGDFDFDPAHIDSYYESLRKSGGIAGVFPMEKIMQIDDIQAP